MSLPSSKMPTKYSEVLELILEAKSYSMLKILIILWMINIVSFSNMQYILLNFPSILLMFRFLWKFRIINFSFRLASLTPRRKFLKSPFCLTEASLKMDKHFFTLIEGNLNFQG